MNFQGMYPKQAPFGHCIRVNPISILKQFTPHPKTSLTLAASQGADGCVHTLGLLGSGACWVGFVCPACRACPDMGATRD